jgi:hypothetical protein
LLRKIIKILQIGNEFKTEKMKGINKLFLVIALAIYALMGSNLVFAQNIDVYTKEGCGRCAYAIKYLREKGFAFNEFAIKNEVNKSKMWSLIIRSSGGLQGQTRTPG